MTALSLQVQLVGKAFAPQVLDIFNEAIANSTAMYEYDPRTPEIVNQWFDEKAEKSLPVIGIIDNGQLLGFGTYGTFRAKPAYNYTVEHSVYTHVDSRGKGVARAVLGALIKQAKDNGYHTMIGGIDTDNTASIGLHLSLGFEHCATIKHAGFKFDRWLDLTFYQLLLDK